MVTLPFTAFLFWLFYRRRKYNYTEHLVAGMYMHGLSTMFFAFIIMLNYIFRLHENYVYALHFAFQIIYFSNFYYGFLNDLRKVKALKAFVASFISVISLFIISGTLVFLYMIKVF